MESVSKRATGREESKAKEKKIVFHNYEQKANENKVQR